MIKKQEVIGFLDQVMKVPFVRRGIKIMVLIYAFAGVWCVFFQDAVLERAANKKAEIEMLRGPDHGKK